MTGDEAQIFAEKHAPSAEPNEVRTWIVSAILEAHARGVVETRADNEKPVLERTLLTSDEFEELDRCVKISSDHGLHRLAYLISRACATIVTFNVSLQKWIASLEIAKAKNEPMKVSTCQWCGDIKSTDDREGMTEHARTCEKSPTVEMLRDCQDGNNRLDDRFVEHTQRLFLLFWLATVDADTEDRHRAKVLEAIRAEVPDIDHYASLKPELMNFIDRPGVRKTVDLRRELLK